MVKGIAEWLLRLVGRSTSTRAIEDARLSTRIIDIHRKSRGIYGSPRVHETLKTEGISVGRKRVERLMRENQLQGRVIRVTYRHVGLKRFTERGENLRLDQDEAERH